MNITTWVPAIFLLLWSGGFTVAKIGIVDADPITLLALRYLCVVILLGLTGAVIVIVANQSVQINKTIGLWFSVAALVGITLATIWEKKFGTVQHPLSNSLIQYSVGFVFAFIFAWFTEPMSITWTTPFVLSFAYLVIANSIFAISLLMLMIQKGEATRVAALFFLVPPVTAFIAWLVIDEAMAPLAWAGMLVAAIGVWLATRIAKADLLK